MTDLAVDLARLKLDSLAGRQVGVQIRVERRESGIGWTQHSAERVAGQEHAAMDWRTGAVVGKMAHQQRMGQHADVNLRIARPIDAARVVVIALAGLLAASEVPAVVNFAIRSVVNTQSACSSCRKSLASLHTTRSRNASNDAPGH